jgi:LPXTG-motif cell wall-anchored protein
MKALIIILLVVAATWCAGHVILVAVVAPSIFLHAVSTPTIQPDHLSRELAGAIFGEVLHRWNVAINSSFLPLLGVLLLALAGVLFRRKRVGLMVVCVLAFISIAGVHRWSDAILNEARATAPPTDPSIAYSAEQRQTFNVLHKRSTTVFSTEAVLLLLLVIGCGVALGRQANADSASAARSAH